MRAAFAYTSAGLYIGPLRQGSKNPGSVLGSWPSRTFNDAESVAATFSGTDYGVFLHCGRSGLVVLDVDEPDAVPADWWPALDAMPFQRSRPANGARGHYIAATPPGRRIGNATGTARKGWGEVRGDNGVIVLAPTRHEKAAEGARYDWVRAGAVPVLPALIADTLPEGGDREAAASDADVAAWRAACSSAAHLPIAERPLRSFVSSVEQGYSRHNAAVRCAVWMAEESAAGLYPAAMLDTLEALFRGAYSDVEKRRARGSASEWRGILAWAVAQVKAEKVAAIRAKFNMDAPGAAPTPAPAPSPYAAMHADATEGWSSLWN